MLIHKRTHGVLNWIWSGTHYLSSTEKKRIPKMSRATFENCGIPPEEQNDYWNIDDDSNMAWTAFTYAPFFDTDVDEEGNLIAVHPWPMWKIYGEKEPPKKEIVKREIDPETGKPVQRKRWIHLNL